MASPSHPTSGFEPMTVAGRRRFTPEFKRHLVELTLHPGASVAGIALAHQLNANQLFKWRREYFQQREARLDDTSLVLLPVEIAPEREPAPAKFSPEPMPAPVGTIDIEIGGARGRVIDTVDPTMLRTILASLRGR